MGLIVQERLIELLRELRNLGKALSTVPDRYQILPKINYIYYLIVLAKQWLLED